jgi:hypothetical protein
LFGGVERIGATCRRHDGPSRGISMEFAINTSPLAALAPRFQRLAR